MLIAATPAGAQTQAQTDTQPPPPAWTGTFGAGLSLTRGNSDTSNVNLSYDAKWDPADHFTFASKGLWLRGSRDGELTANRLSLESRVDRKLDDRTSLFGQVQYARDRFRQVDYLVSPTAGVSHLLVATAVTKLAVNLSVGGVWEKNTGLSVEADGALNAGQQFKHQISETAEFTQNLTALCKIGEFDDSLYTLGAGIAASITSRTQLKVEAIDTYKNKPTAAGVRKNDVSMLVSFVYKF
jgi:putative salt-induced outer membrane protein YdiY